jgi:hypothetical protein
VDARARFLHDGPALLHFASNPLILLQAKMRVFTKKSFGINVDKRTLTPSIFGSNPGPPAISRNSVFQFELAAAFTGLRICVQFPFRQAWLGGASRSRFVRCCRRWRRCGSGRAYRHARLEAAPGRSQHGSRENAVAPPMAAYFCLPERANNGLEGGNPSASTPCVSSALAPLRSTSLSRIGKCPWSGKLKTLGVFEAPTLEA